MACRLVPRLVPVCVFAAVMACDSSSPTRPSPADCSRVTLSPPAQNFAAAGGSGTITITIAAGCAWTAAVTAPWVTITGGASGSGPGTVAFSVAQNPLLPARTASLNVAGQSSAITQEGAAIRPDCTFDVRPLQRAVPAGGAGFLIMVNAPFDCLWAFSSQTPWFEIIPETEGAPNGNGNGSVEGHVAPNPDPGPRTGTGLVAGRTITVVQDGTASAACQYTFDPGPARFSAAGGQGQARVTTAPECSWTVERDGWGEDMLRLNLPTRGAGTSAVPYVVLPNASMTSRFGHLLLYGDSGAARLQHRVEQAAASCLYAVSPSQVTVAASGTTSPGGQPIRISVTATPGDCSWTTRATADWLSIAPGFGDGRGTGAGNVYVQIAANGTGAERRAELIVAGLSGVNPPATVTVIQRGP